MNFILTTLWLTFMTAVGYFVGDNFFPEHVTLTTIVFFFIGLVIRFLPQASGDLVGAILD